VADADEFGEVAGSMFDFICSCISPLLKSIALAVVFRAVCVHLFAIHIRDSEFSLYKKRNKILSPAMRMEDLQYAVQYFSQPFCS